jgi:hypothetical protein
MVLCKTERLESSIFASVAGIVSEAVLMIGDKSPLHSLTSAGIPLTGYQRNKVTEDLEDLEPDGDFVPVGWNLQFDSARVIGCYGGFEVELVQRNCALSTFNIHG